MALFMIGTFFGGCGWRGELVFLFSLFVNILFFFFSFFILH